MTTERSGMSLEQVRDLLRFSANEAVNMDALRLQMAAVIDTHLAAINTDSEAAVDNLHQLACEYGDTDDAGTGYDFSMEQFDEFAKAVVSSFAARPAAVPDERALYVKEFADDEPKFQPNNLGVAGEVYFFRVGWNAYRAAMLAQWDGG